MSVGSRSAVPWTRPVVPPMEQASALARTVLPRPGVSSMSTCPPASAPAITSRVSSSLPSTTWPMLVASAVATRCAVASDAVVTSVTGANGNRRNSGYVLASVLIEVPTGQLYIGEGVDAATHERDGTPTMLPAADLTTHGVIVGMTGSGKTGLGIAVLEEALLSGVPTLVLDPKGDLTDLLLTFPDLAAADFAPWVESGDPAAVATQWSEGLASWGMDGARIKALRDAASFTV